MSANHQTQRPPHLAGGVGLLVLFPFCGAVRNACAKDENVDLVQAEADLIDLILGFRMLKKSNTHLKSSILGVWMTSSFTLMGSLVRSTKLLHEAVKVDLFNQLLLDISFGWLK